MGVVKGTAIVSSPLYLPLLTSRVISVPSAFVTVTGADKGFARYLEHKSKSDIKMNEFPPFTVFPPKSMLMGRVALTHRSEAE